MARTRIATGVPLGGEAVSDLPHYRLRSCCKGNESGIWKITLPTRFEYTSCALADLLRAC